MYQMDHGNGTENNLDNLVNHQSYLDLAPCGTYSLTKRAFDIAIAVVALLLLLPLLGVIAIAVKLSSPGPVFFCQRRAGMNGKLFYIYKFRSMKVHRESGMVKQAVRNDPRLTRIGGFLRKTSLDELPQLINVLVGDMSIVGPRPHATGHDELYSKLIGSYMLRQCVKPGITGWAQINGSRGETDTLEKMMKRVDLDLQYVRNWSVWLDIKIVTWTALKGWTDRNAY